MSPGITAGLSVACLGIALLLLLVIILVFHVRKERRYKREMQSIKDLLVPQGNLIQLNPNCTIDEQASCLPYDPKWEVPREYIKFGKRLSPFVHVLLGGVSYFILLIYISYYLLFPDSVNEVHYLCTD